MPIRLGFGNSLVGKRDSCPAPAATIRPVASVRVRTVAGVVGKILLGAVAAVVLGGAVLVILAYYADMKFDVREVVIAVVVAGLAVFLWTRWR